MQPLRQLDPSSDTPTPRFGEPAPTPVDVKISILPFVVRLVRTELQLHKVCELRAAAYGHHMPEFGERLMEPESYDTEPGTVILVAEDKITGSAVGTLRIHLNTHKKLPLEAAITLPERMQGHFLVEISRLSVRPGYSQMDVRLALFKAAYLFCYANQVQYMLVGARRPLDRIYKSVTFKPINGKDEWIPLAYANNIEHTVLVFDVLMAERIWYHENHRLYPFFKQTYHPDLQVFSAVSSGWTNPRRITQGA
jgi:hypothetical protein